MLLFNKTQSERRTIGLCKATKEFQIFLKVFEQTLVIKPCSGYADKIYIVLDLLTFPPSRMTNSKSSTKLCIIKL